MSNAGLLVAIEVGELCLPHHKIANQPEYQQQQEQQQEHHLCNEDLLLEIDQPVPVDEMATVIYRIVVLHHILQDGGHRGAHKWTDGDLK